MSIVSVLNSKRLYFDGGYGTLFQSMGLKPGELPELWNFEHADVVTNLHYEYLSAGANIIKTNTFGANRLKFGDKLEEIIAAAVSNVKNAISKLECAEQRYIALDIGPLGKLLKPFGDLEFEDAIDIFGEIAEIGNKYGVDLVLIETMNDSYETKAAVLGVKEHTNLPVFVTNAYDETGKLMTGANPCAMIALLEGLKVDALGVNCSLGPDKMKPIVEEYIKYSSTPVVVNPNAGLPVVKNGETVFDYDSEKFAISMSEFAKMGVSVLGGCCGTTPSHVKKSIELIDKIPYVAIPKKEYTVVSSYSHAVVFKDKPIIIGERINPTGKPRFKEALKNKDMAYILNEGSFQQDAGAHILDVNVGLPEIDEKQILKETVFQLQTVVDIPLQIDTSDFVAMENAMRCYNGKPMLNSVNGKDEVLDKFLPLAAKYGAVIIALTLDENGIPDTVCDRLRIADKIIERAAKFGISKKDIIVDPLALTISTDTQSALVTIETIKELKKSGIRTSLGVSNVSFGLPGRSIINSTFLTLAMHSGLDAAIMNPNSKEMMDAYYAFCALSNFDQNCEEYIKYAANAIESTKEITVENQDYVSLLKHSIIKGLKEESVKNTGYLLKESDSFSVINKCIIPALNYVGEKFENKELFLPQLLMSAEAAKCAFEVIKCNMSETNNDNNSQIKILIATVKGDIHDIGKNIVKALLENYNFNVIDLGKDVPAEEVVKTAIDENVSLVGLSALMTTTVPAMADTIKLLREKAPWCKIVVGGAVLTKEYSEMIGADKYAKDAMETVRYAESLI